MAGMPGDLTSLINRARNGDREADAALFERIESELHHLAEAQMRGERRGHTLQATALVNEAYVRIAGRAALRFEDRSHFMRAVAQVMRHLLVDHARARKRLKRGGDNRQEPQSPLDTIVERSGVDLVALNDALEQLAELSPRQAELVELRFFGGMTAQEAADLLGVSKRTADSDWSMARAWLAAQLRD